MARRTSAAQGDSEEAWDGPISDDLGGPEGIFRGVLGLRVLRGLGGPEEVGGPLGISESRENPERFRTSRVPKVSGAGGGRGPRQGQGAGAEPEGVSGARVPDKPVRASWEPRSVGVLEVPGNPDSFRGPWVPKGANPEGLGGPEGL